MFTIITSLAKEVNFWWRWFVCLFVDNITQKVMNGLGWNFMGGVLGSTVKNWWNFGGDLGILRWENEQKDTIIVVAYPDCSAGNDPNFYFFILFLFFGGGGGSLSPPRLNSFTVGNMGVMICLGKFREVCTLWVILVNFIIVFLRYTSIMLSGHVSW